VRFSLLEVAVDLLGNKFSQVALAAKVRVEQFIVIQAIEFVPGRLTQELAIDHQREVA
jgi:hypothetical protein